MKLKVIRRYKEAMGFIMDYKKTNVLEVPRLNKRTKTAQGVRIKGGSNDVSDKIDESDKNKRYVVQFLISYS